MVNFKKLADKAKDVVDKRGGTDASILSFVSRSPCHARHPMQAPSSGDNLAFWRFWGSAAGGHAVSAGPWVLGSTSGCL